jgi:cyclase
MRRGMVLGMLLVLGGLAIVKAQSPSPDAPKVIEVEKVKDNLWVLRGGGGNTAVFATAGGVVVVDAKNPGWGQPVLDKIKTLTDKPVTTLINTHTHGDHVSGNVAFADAVEIVTHENTKANMDKMPIFKENAGRGLPDKTFKDKMTLGKGADQVDLYYFGPGHTNGDAWVVFPAHRIVHAGDLFARKGMPFIDGSNGGSVLHYPDTLMKAYNGIKNVDTIINGHMPAQSTWADLKEYSDFNRDFLTFAQAQLKTGKTAEEAAAEWKVPEKYKGYSPEVRMDRLKGQFETLAAEMKK